MKKIEGLNTLRFFSFLWIFLFHTTSFVGFGYLAVDFFFIISSFLLTLLALHEIDHTGNFKKVNFFVRRSLRIFPLYYLVIAFTFFIMPLVSSYFGEVPKLPDNQFLYWLFLSNYDHGDYIFSLGFLWTIAVEEQFYLMFLLLSFLLFRNVILMAMLLLIGYVLFSIYAMQYEVSTYANTLNYLVDFAAGILGAFLYFKKKINFSPLLALLISLLGVFIFKENFLYKVFIATAFVSIIFLTIQHAASMKHAYIFKATEKLGEYSYGLYVYSGFVITVMLKQNFIKNDFLIVGFEFLLTLGIAVLSYHLYEKHFLKLKNYFRT